MIARKLDPAIGENKYVLVITPREAWLLRVALLDGTGHSADMVKDSEALYEQLLEITGEDD